MNCPRCDHPSSRITDTVRVPEGLRRHRVCGECGKRFKTLERIEDWDHVTRKYVRRRADPVEAAVVAVGGNVIRLEQAQPPAERPAANRRFTAHLNHIALAPVCPDAQQLLVQWWNESRRSKHGAKATWTESAWKASLDRVAKLPAWQQVLLAQAGVEHGWQALKADYVKDDLARPTVAGRPMPKDPAMLAALEQWPEQTA